MEAVSLIGWITVGFVLALITFLVLYSNRIIRRIEKNGGQSLREILRNSSLRQNRRDKEDLFGGKGGASGG